MYVELGISVVPNIEYGITMNVCYIGAIYGEINKFASLKYMRSVLKWV